MIHNQYREKYGDNWREFVKYGRWSKYRTMRETRDGNNLFRNSGLFDSHHGFADEIDGSIRHTGWHTDDHGGTARGFVLRIRSCNGTYYAPGVYFSDRDGTRADLSRAEIVPRGSEEYEHEQAARDVASWADDMARDVAETEREHNRRQDLLCDAEAERWRIRETIAALRENQGPATAGILHRQLCEQWTEYRQTMSEATQ